MGEARARRSLGLSGARPNPEPFQYPERHVLALIDRRIEPGDEPGETRFTDHSAKPNTYVSVNLRTLYHWDGVRLRRLDKMTRTSDTTDAS